MRPIAAAAEAAGISHSFAPVATHADVERAFDALGDRAGAAAHEGPQLGLPSEWLSAIALRRRVVLIGNARDALMSHTFEHADEDRSIASIIDKIFRGANPAEIPFELPERMILVINRATAKAIGVTFPQEILLRATRVIG